MPRAKHPGATGVAPPNLQRLTQRQEADLRRWIRDWKLAYVDEDAFLNEVANAVWLYPSLKALADESSAGSIRRNLDAAITAGNRFLGALNDLDGGSLFALTMHTHGRSIKQEAAEILLALCEVRQRAERFPKRGPRPAPEKIQFASLLLRALRQHTSASPKSTQAGIFESLLCYGFALAGEKRAGKKYENLHGLAAKTLAADLKIEDDGGVRTIPSPE